MPAKPPFSAYVVELRIAEGTPVDTDEQIEDMAERIEDAFIADALRLAVNAALERAGLNRIVIPTITT